MSSATAADIAPVGADDNISTFYPSIQPWCKGLVSVCLALVVSCIPEQLYAQFTSARSYDNSPVGVNQLEFDYAYARTNASIDTSLIVGSAQLNLNQGAGDSSYEVAMLLKGDPALSVAQFAGYKQTTTIGVSLTITAPTGLYNGNKVLNLGSDRWSFKPEFAVSHPFGPEQKWEVDAYITAYFFTDDTSFRGREVLRQQALPGFEGHLSYSFTNNFWVSVDTRYSFRGGTFVDGVDQHDGQQNFILGNEANISLSPHNSLVFEFAKALVHQNGPAKKGFAVEYIYSWGNGYK